jgi:hypothetical protein
MRFFGGEDASGGCGRSGWRESAEVVRTSHFCSGARGDAPQAKLDKLDTVLAQTSTLPEDAALIAAMLSLPNDGRYPALALIPEQRRQQTLEALT